MCFLLWGDPLWPNDIVHYKYILGNKHMHCLLMSRQMPCLPLGHCHWPPALDIWLRLVCPSCVANKKIVFCDQYNWCCSCTWLVSWAAYWCCCPWLVTRAGPSLISLDWLHEPHPHRSQVISLMGTAYHASKLNIHDTHNPCHRAMVALRGCHFISSNTCGT